MSLRGPDRISPFVIPMGIPNIGSGQIAIQFGMTGPNFTTVSACATGGHALGESSEIIRRGDADVMVAGGAEASIFEAIVGAFAAMRAVSTRNDDPAAASRPFDRGRDGFVIGEGSGVVILEALEHAEARGAPILAELAGYGATADASHITLPAPGGIGAVRAARRALEKADMDATEIDHVNAHATSTPEGDPAELQAIRTIFGDHAGRIPITANKSMLGHTLGAAGAIEAIASILTIRDGCVPPTINLTDPDPLAAGLDLTPNRAAKHARPGRPEQLVRLRWPEHRPHLPAVGPMTDDVTTAGSAATGSAGPPPSTRRRRWRRVMPSCSALIDRLAELLQRSDLIELEIESGGTGADPPQGGRPAAGACREPHLSLPAATRRRATREGNRPPPAVSPPCRRRRRSRRRSRASSTPRRLRAAHPYVQVGGEVAVGQVIGLIEAMKLFNEIKSDLAGRVVRVLPESGALVKAKQPLIEVEPL